MGTLIAYIFPFIGSVIGAFFREALSQSKIIFLQISYIIFWYIYCLFFI